jgi:hypothetical protein
MPDAMNQRVLRATWNWRSADEGGSVSGTAGLRRQAVIQTVVMVLVAAFLFFILDHTFFVPFILGLAALVLILGLAYPPAYRPIHRFGRWLGRAVGKGLTYLLLVPFFFLFFTPVALLLRLQGRDPLHRGFRDAQWTYWIRRSPKDRDENIDRQFLREDKVARDALRAVGSGTESKGTAGS